MDRANIMSQWLNVGRVLARKTIRRNVFEQQLARADDLSGTYSEMETILVG